MKLGKVVIVTGLAALLLAGCSTEASTKVTDQLTSPYVTNTDHQKQDDIALQTKIQDMVKAQLPGSAVKIVVNNYNVLLLGQVAAQADKTTVENICKNLAIVKQVFDYLTISAKPSLNINTSMLNKATTRIQNQSNIDASAVNISIVDNVVYLMGTNIGDLTAFNLAIGGISSIEGVNKVVNLIQKGKMDYYTTSPEDN